MYWRTGFSLRRLQCFVICSRTGAVADPAVPVSSFLQEEATVGEPLELLRVCHVYRETVFDKGQAVENDTLPHHLLRSLLTSLEAESPTRKRTTKAQSCRDRVRPNRNTFPTPANGENPARSCRTLETIASRLRRRRGGEEVRPDDFEEGG